MTIIFAISYIILNSIIWRFRGGGFFETGSTQLVRAIAGLAIATPLALWFVDPYIMVLAIAVFFGLVLASWGDFFDMGTNEVGKSRELVSPLIRWLDPNSVTHDLVGMSLTGIVMVLPSVIVLGWLGMPVLPIAVAGSLMGLVYLLSWKVWEYPKSIGNAELMMGAVLATGFLLTFFL